MKNAILKTLEDGGLTLWALLVVAVMIYSISFSIWQHMRQARKRVEGEEWKKQNEVTGVMPWERVQRDARQLERSFATFELDEIAWVERRLPFLGVLIAAAPLLGLLGTVAGMLVTFGGMASGAGSEPLDVISGGISKALVTTQAGLVIAVPAAFLFAQLKRATESTQLELQRQLHEALKGVTS